MGTSQGAVCVRAAIQDSKIHSVGVRPVFGDHRSVKRDQAGVDKLSEQRCDIAVADEDLRMVRNLLPVEIPQQVVRAVTAARAHDGADFVALEHFFQFA